MAIYAKIKGAKQGDIKGGVATQAYIGQIQVNEIDFGLGGGFDVLSGQATGRRVARPVIFTKPLDKSSPLLFSSCSTNEALSVKFSYTIEGEGHKAYVTVELTNAMIREFAHVGSANGLGTEKLTLTYTKIEFTWVEGGISAEDDWIQRA